MKLVRVLCVLVGLTVAQDRLVDRLASDGIVEKAAIINNNIDIYMSTDNFGMSQDEISDVISKLNDFKLTGDTIQVEGDSYVIHYNRDDVMEAKKGTSGLNSMNGDVMTMCKTNNNYLIVICKPGVSQDDCRISLENGRSELLKQGD